ncbi:MAG: penicillin-binding protein 2 [Patescibacteria group bacterium]
MALKNKFFEDFISESLRSKMKLMRHEVQAEDVVWEHNSRQPISKTVRLSRFIFVFALIAIALGAIVLRTAELQILQGTKWRAVAEGNRIREIVVPARRGEILDINLIPMAKNIPAEQATVIPGDFPDKEKFAEISEKLSSILSVPKEEILDRLEKIFEYKEIRQSYEPIILAEEIKHEAALSLMEHSESFPGVKVYPSARRSYPEKEIISHSMGYIGKLSQAEWDSLPRVPNESGYLKSDFIGKSGLEYIYEKELRGIYGWQRIEVDSMGREQKIISETLALPGKDLITSIDARVQKKAFESLRDSLKKVGAKAGSAVALNPQNGEIIALANLPSYDNNSFITGLTEQDRTQFFQSPERPLLFRAISGIYPSGSTIKPLIAVAALAEGVITPKTTILSTGGIRIGASFFPDWKAGGHGAVDVKRAIAESVNTFFYTVGGGYEKFKGLGVEKLDSYMTLFGLGEKTGIDLPGEAAGLVPDPSWKRTVKKEKWYIGDTYHLSIGQGDLLTTPLQMASVTAAIANGGTIFQPHLVKGYLDQRTNNIIEIKPKKEPEKLSIAASAFDTVRQGMRQTVLSGSGRALSGEPFEVAAKTGTAEAPSGNPHGWFIAFAPFTNPEIAVAVMVENGGEGYISALPVARDILQEYFRLKN